MYKSRFFAVLMLLILGIGTIQEPRLTSAQGIGPDSETSSKPEVPQELTIEEFQKEVEAFYKQYSHYIVTVDLEDPDGIDPELLPDDIASLVDSNTKVVAYKETKRPDSEQPPDSEQVTSPVSSLSSSCVLDIKLGIWCRGNDGTRDLTVSDNFGGVEQFNRVWALRYDNYQGWYTGWEIEKQWAWWKRTNTSWSVSDAQMKTYIPGEDYCTQNPATLNHYSAWFTPSWSGNNSYIYNISGFPNNAYVPIPSGWSRTQGDIYQYGTRKYNDAQTHQYWAS